MPAAGRTVGIGAVLEQLAVDFPDISISKIRYLEAQGLITPDRTPKGSRRYHQSDVERLRFVLTAQRDRFWPLKVIREHLDALDRGLVPVGDEAPSGATAPPPAHDQTDPETIRPGRPLRLTAAELQQASNIDGQTLRELVSYGLVRTHGGHYGRSDLDVATAAGALVARGIEVRHLRPFRTAAEREVGLADHLRVRGSDDRSRQEQAAEIAAACLDLHTALVRAEIGRLDG